MSAPVRAVALVSGHGTNLEALLATQHAGWLPLALAAVVSNRPGAPALARASRYGAATEVVDHTRYGERTAFETDLARAIDRYSADLVILAGFMRVLSAAFIARYRQRLINIHPSLLPDFKGLDTHRRALEAGVAYHGATVHFVTAELDAGPAVLQARVAVRADDDADTLAARVRAREHRLYPLALRWLAEGRLRFDGTDAWLDGERLARPVIDPPALDEVPHVA